MNTLLKLVYFLNFKTVSKSLKTKNQQEDGYVFFVVLVICLSTLALLTAYARITQTEKLRSNASADTNSAFYAAEASLNLRVEGIRQTFTGYNTPSGAPPESVEACLDDNSNNDGSGDFGCEVETFRQSSRDQSPFESASYIIAKNGGDPRPGIVPRGELFQNLSMLEYAFAIHSVAKETAAPSSELGASLKMDITSRLIPMFQFAAFYANDLEILPGPTMDLRGPVHTNGSLYLGANNNNGLSLPEQVTVGGSLFNRRKNNNDTYPDGRVRIRDAAGNWLNLLRNGTGSTNRTTNPMDPERVQAAWGTQVQVGVDPVIIPSPSFLDTSGAYYQKADLRIEYKPAATSSNDYLQNVPFEIQVRDSAGTYQDLTEGQLRSLQQPVMLGNDLENADYCSAPSSPNISSITNDNEEKGKIIESLQTAIAAQVEPIQFSKLDSKINTSSNLKEAFEEALGNRLSTSLTQSEKDDLFDLTPKQIAAISYKDSNNIEQGQRCFLPAPIRDIGRDNSSHNSTYRFYNDREDRDMRLLQFNFESLAAWNRDGIYVDFNNNQGNLDQHKKADELLFERANPDNAAPNNSFQKLGLAAQDDSEGGLVFHGTIDQDDYSKAKTSDSPYGFILSGGEQLMALSSTANNPNPTGLTFASDQAVYVQGNYNTVNKQPASVLADSLNVLSEACRNQDGLVNKSSGRGCNPDINDPGGNKANAVNTEINSAFLANTDITNSAATSGYNGGLENYPRFSENWGGRTLRYRGSFVSLGTPRHVSGTWSNQLYGAPNRDWEYDMSFNEYGALPPLSPRFIHVKQSAFERYLD
ncbi:hypothetical protein AWQ21_15410 (plasmid) [Picosynechococcus sp. PCC 7003]|uniref:hypothetical protein n=1 Tax=Picosynechococcus sp. PCC 7003 TaxID=374981 RepID=UPI000810E09C|nr:hypothetical protein [Picosynechococcus sp. PCC 7003]ANV85914.1 hypothetical protein AWQ21_15410 [Picosynechococcus sp. PCC 7003]